MTTRIPIHTLLWLALSALPAAAATIEGPTEVEPGTLVRVTAKLDDNHSADWTLLTMASMPIWSTSIGTPPKVLIASTRKAR